MWPQAGSRTLAADEAIQGGDEILSSVYWPSPPCAARAQQSKRVRRIAVALAAFPADVFTDKNDDPFVKAFFSELHRLGYFEGENLLIERYSGEGQTYPDLARDVVRRDPDLIFATNTPLVINLKAATTTIPIVGVFGLPVESGTM
jgi:putative tryptophan/tyrosine transport system substrate-binding protein